MDAETLEFIVRSRPTICEILTDRGYNADGYRGVSPGDLLTLVATNLAALTMIAKKREGSIAPMERAVVRYMVESPIRLSLDKISDLFDEDKTDDPYDASKDEIIIIHNEPHHDAFTAQAQRQWIKSKARVSFFPLKNILSNPAHHSFVPPHRKLMAEEAASVMRRLYAESKAFPHIKFHADMQARILGLVPGDLVEIRRPSETSGITTLFRVCTL